VVDPSDEEDEEYVRGRVAALEESVRFFGNAGKKKRELWVCKQLVDALGVGALGEIVHVDDDPPDCLFAGAKLEVKEVQDDGRRRHAEYRAALGRARAATKAADLLEEMEVIRITVGEFAERAMQVAAENEAKYGTRIVAELDLVVYVNLDGWKERGEDLSLPREYESAWRSVSMVENAVVAVLCAASDAPQFLRDAVGKVYPRVPID
jgi:hypothetical protein